MRFAFWNIARNWNAWNMLPALASEQDLDLILLVEVPEAFPLEVVNRGGDKYQLVAPPMRRLRVHSRLVRGEFALLEGSFRFGHFRVQIPGMEDFLLCLVHQPAPVNYTLADRNAEVSALAFSIRKLELRVGHSRTLLVGDFNLDPHNDGLIAANGLHAVMDRQLASEGDRVVNEQRYPFFFNPMWRHYGDGVHRPAGSYFYRSSGQVAQFWHLFDQVLVRPQLLDSYPEQNEFFVTSIGGTSLLNTLNRPDKRVASDHLPLVFELHPKPLLEDRPNE